MPTVPSGSTKKSVPSPPDQPMRPRPDPSVFTATPKPHPVPSQNPGKKQLALRHPQRGVGHPERPENVLGQMLTERAARHPRDEDAEHGKRMVIAPSFSRLER